MLLDQGLKGNIHIVTLWDIENLLPNKIHERTFCSLWTFLCKTATICKNAQLLISFVVYNILMFIKQGTIHLTRALTYLSHRCYEQVYKIHKPHAVKSPLLLVLCLRAAGDKWATTVSQNASQLPTQFFHQCSAGLSLWFDRWDSQRSDWLVSLSSS